MIEVMNMDHDIPTYPYDYKIDRSTPLGNPFIMHNESERDEVCEKYRAYFNDTELFKNSYMDEIKKSLMKHGRVRLFCWCAPKACHGNTIKTYLETWQSAEEC